MDTRIVIGAAGIIVGAGVGALITYRVLKTHYDQIVQEEINSVKVHYAKIFKDGSYADLSGIVSKYKNEIDDLGYSGVQSSDDNDSDESPENDEEVSSEIDRESEFVEIDREIDDEVPEQHNIWRNAANNPHPEDEAYVITFEQFNDEHDDYDKGDLTYYEEDDTLVDSQESPIDDVDGLIGPDALTRFGDGSNSPDIVYVRNDRISMDFEISRDSRSYTDHILGIPTNKKRKVQKMRAEE